MLMIRGRTNPLYISLFQAEKEFRALCNQSMQCCLQPVAVKWGAVEDLALELNCT